VPLVEDQVDDGEHGRQPPGQVGLGRDAVRDSRVPDLALGPDQPLGHGGLRHQERVRDLRRGEPAQQPERQRDLGAGAQRRVAAGEHEPQPVIAHGPLLFYLLVPGMEQRGLGVLVRAGRLAPQPVDGPVAGGGDDPAGRAGRQSGLGPSPGGLRERVLDRVLGGVDIAEDAGQDGHRAAVLPAEDAFDVGERRWRGGQSSTSS
jgi:hypothetical protein